MEQLKEHWLYRLLQVIVLIMTGLFGAVIMQMLGTFLATVIWSLEWDQLILMDAKMMKADSRLVHATQLTQALTSIGAFVFPVLYFGMRDQVPFLEYSGLKEKPKLKHIGFALAAILLMMPPVNYLAEYLYGYSLPEAYKDLELALRKGQERVIELQAAMMQGNGILNFILHALIVAVIPAVCEELFFRRALPKQLFNLSRNVHVSVWISALLFGLIHLSAYNTLSITLVGALFGYLVLWTGNIWIPIMAHFTNNFISLILFKLEQGEEAVAISYPEWFIGVCVAALLGLVWYLHRQYQETQE